MNEREITLSDSDFDKAVTEAAVPLLVDFWAPWCGPCRFVAPVLEQIASERKGGLIIGKLNVDDNPLTAQRFNIQCIPTMILFKGGKPVEQIVGALPKEMLEKALGPHLN